MAYTPSLARLIRELSRLPGIGEKTATRLALFMLRADGEYAHALADAIVAVKQETRLCSRCFSLTETDPCGVCADPRRSSELICVVEDPADLLAVERAGEFRGQYHVLHGALAPLDGIGPDDLKIQPLVERIRRETVREVILATNPTVEGDTTAISIYKEAIGARAAGARSRTWKSPSCLKSSPAL